MFYVFMYLVTYLLLLFTYCFFFQKQPPKCSIKKAVLENFTIFTGKCMCSSLSNTLAGLQACDFIKKRPQYRCFPANIAKFLRTSVLKNTCKRQPILIFSGNIMWLRFISYTLSSPVCIPSCYLKRL